MPYSMAVGQGCRPGLTSRLAFVAVSIGLRPFLMWIGLRSWAIIEFWVLEFTDSLTTVVKSKRFGPVPNGLKTIRSYYGSAPFA